jgi:hypothetical protein
MPSTSSPASPERTYADRRFARAATDLSPALVSRCPGVVSVP